MCSGCVEYDMSTADSTPSLAKVLTDAVNSGVDSDEFAKEVANSHSYLQGAVFDQVVKPLICEYARRAEDGQYDPRNKRQVKECRDIADAMDWSY